MEYVALAGQYHLGKTIGCGGFAKVKLATHILTGEKVAIKIMRKQSLKEDLPRVKHEINALKSLCHSNICKLYQIIETPTHYFLVMEYCCGGELFDHIVQKEKLTEEEARQFFQQIVSAVSYLHSQGFAHRDLKPENILLDKNHNLKLIDFGLSVKPENGLEACLYTSCGSPNYAAPELIKGEKYLGPEIDIWSLGVLLYALLCGTLPFDDSSIQKLYEKILSGYYEEKKWLSSESKSLLQALLQVNARKRISTDKLKLHPWFKKGFERLDSLHSYPKLKYDAEIAKLLSEHFNLSVGCFWDEIKKENYDYLMATYLLLLDKKRNNEPIELVNETSSPRKRVLSTTSRQSEYQKCGSNENESPLTRTGTYVIKRDQDGIRRSTRNDENRQSGRRNCKRLRSPGIGERNGPETKKMKQIKTPISKKNLQNDSTPRSAKKILDGLEWGLSKAKAALTPRRKNIGTAMQPVVLWGKDLCNVSCTNSTSPDDTLVQLQNALNAKGISCVQKGLVDCNIEATKTNMLSENCTYRYTLRGKLRLQSEDKKKAKDQEDKLSFELEVCWIPCPSEMNSKNMRSAITDSLKGAVVGIRRKRLRGDAWIYKNICEEVLALAAPLKTN